MRNAQSNRTHLDSGGREQKSKTKTDEFGYPNLDFGFVSDFDIQVLDLLICILHPREDG